MLTAPQAILDDLNAANELLNHATLSQEEYDDTLLLISTRSAELQATMENLTLTNKTEYVDLLALSSTVHTGLEALVDVSDVIDGLNSISASLEANTIQTTTQKTMVQVALDAYATRVGLPTRTISQEGITGTIKTIWDALIKLLKKVVDSVKSFFKAIWRFLTGKKRELKDTQKAAKDIKATDQTVEAYVERQNKKIAELTSDTADNKHDKSEALVKVRKIREKSLYLRRLAKQDATPVETKTFNQDVYMNARAFDVDATRLGRKVAAFANETDASKYTSEGVNFHLIGTHPIAFDLIGYIEKLDQDIENFADKGRNGTFDWIVEKVKDHKGTVDTVLPELIEKTHVKTVGVQHHRKYVGPNGTTITFQPGEGGVVTHNLWGDTTFTMKMPAPNAIDTIVTQAQKVADTDKVLKRIDKNIQSMVKLLESFKDGKLDGVTDQQMTTIQDVIRVYFTRILIPTTQACAEAVAEYSNFVSMITKEVTEFYNLDLDKD